MNNTFNQLLVRPSPYSGESLNGYFLRVAEANGYRSGHWMLNQFMNVHRSNLLLPVNLTSLSQLMGHSEESLLRLAYLPDEDRQGKYVRYFGHSLHFRCMKSLTPALCPLCLAETAATHGFWELNHVAVCPLHGIRLIDQCRDCGKLVKWDRQRVSFCNCGFDFRNAKTNESEPGPLELMRVLYHVANFSLLEYAPHSEYGLPMELLQKESVSSLIWMISTLGRYSDWGSNTSIEGPDYSYRLTCEYENLIRVANILCYWPASLVEGMYETFIEADDYHRYLNWHDIRYLHPLYKALLSPHMPVFIQDIGKGFFEIVRHHQNTFQMDWDRFQKTANQMIEVSTCF